MTFDKVKEIIMETLHTSQDKITLEATIMDDLGADSLDAMELSMALEDAFEIKIEEDAISNFKTVKDVVDYIDANK
ncbi:MAG: acyl carrier protein [Lachnospiraceae bacterium]|nr:acyl carrier protein [Lachnospiraceae bacterium]